MKTIFRVLTLGIFMTAFTAVSFTTVFAQDVCNDLDSKQDLYEKKFQGNFQGKTVEQKQTAIDAAKQYISKFGACEDDKPIIDYLKSTVPALEKDIVNINTAAKATENNARFNRFDAALKSKNTAETFAVGKEILAVSPDLVDVYLVLATVGYDQARMNPPVNTYNNETISYAKSAIDKIQADKPSATKGYGVLAYSYKNKENALGWMNYITGYVMYYGQNKKEEALPYLYKASQTDNASTKTDAVLYQTIGGYYRDQVARLGDEIVAKLKETENQATDEVKALIALQKGYSDRAIDAYARAYNVADKSAANKQYRDGLLATLKDIYRIRYEGKRDDVDAYVSSVMSRPLPDPTTKVTPVEEDADATATTMAPGAKPAMMTPSTAKPAAPAAAKPATTPKPAATTKPVSSTTTESKTADTNSNSEAKTKIPAKKSTVKKKGTR